MPTDPERRKRIQEDARWLRAQTIDLDNAGPALPFDCLAELLAYQAELCRAEGYDEAEMIEVLLTAMPRDKEDLLGADAVLAPLGYRSISSVLKRLARRAPPKPLSPWEQWKLKSEGKPDAGHRISRPVDVASYDADVAG